MKTVTQDFLDALNRPMINVRRLVYYKRRYWDTDEYVWESSWTLLPEDEIVSVSSMINQLDTQTQNAFKVSNVTLNIKNFDNLWFESHSAGHFAADDDSALGYEPYWMKFKVESGLVFDDGSDEMLTMFSGVATDWVFNTRDHTVQVNVGGLQELLVKTNAEGVSTQVTTESLGTGDAIETVFTTDNNAVGIVQAVYIAGSLKRPGVDYTIDQLNDVDLPAQITFTSPPGGSTALTVDYLYWQTDKKVEELVESLLDLVPIDAGNQEITPAVFPNQVASSHLFAGQTDWEAGTVLNNNTKDGSGDLKTVLPYSPALLGGSVTGDAAKTASLVSITQPGGFAPGYNTNISGSYGLGFISGGNTQVQVAAPISLSAGEIDRIGVVGWEQTVPTDTFALRIWSDTAGAPGTLLWTSSSYTATTYDAITPAGNGVTLPGGTIVSAGAATYWIGLVRTSGAGFISRTFMSSPGGALTDGLMSTGTAANPTWVTLTNSGGDRRFMLYCHLIPYALTGTWTSPWYDTYCSNIETGATLTATGNYPTNTAGTAYIDGSDDGSAVVVTSSQASLNGTQAFTLTNHRYWRIRYTLSTSLTMSYPTIGPPTLSWGSVSTWISAVLDQTITPTSYGPLQIVETLNGGSATYWTSSSTDGISYDAYVEVNGSLVPQSALKRYIKFKVLQTLDVSNTATPALTSMEHFYYADTVLITLANFTSLNVHDAIAQLATLANYEFGFSADDVFFFRPRRGSITPVMFLDEKNFIVDVLSMKPGYETVYSTVRAIYGAYTAEVKDTALLSTDPFPRFGASLYEPSVSNFLVSADADLASNVATAQFAYNKYPRKKIKIATKFLPHLDLSDIVSVAFSDAESSLWYYGDPLHYYGDPSIYYSAEDFQALPPTVAKLVGCRVDTDSWNCELDLEEVI